MNKQEGMNMASVVRNDNTLYLKLMTAGLLLNTAKSKVELFMQMQKRRFIETHDDHITLEDLELYYDSEKDELLHCAENDCYTANEAEKELDFFLKENFHNERD